VLDLPVEKDEKEEEEQRMSSFGFKEILLMFNKRIMDRN
jgi:hypothetical protein